MVRKFLFAGVPVLAAALLLLPASPGQARSYRGVAVAVGPRAFYGGYGGFYARGFYPGYYARPYRWSYYGFYPGYFGTNYYYSTPYFYPGYAYSEGYYPGYEESYTYSQPVQTTEYSSFYPPEETAGYAAGPAAVEPNAVLIRLTMPPDAELWFNGEKTTQTGSAREFVSPPLTPGKDYTYTVHARWMQNGQEVDRDRTLTVHAGDRLNLDLMAAAPPPATRTAPLPAPAATEELQPRPPSTTPSEPAPLPPQVSPRQTDEGTTPPYSPAEAPRSSRPVP
jgi:uncharacterized protein (TIGR03000 family)